MSDPAPYTVSYSFAGWQALHPADPLPALEVDNEFANVATAISGLVDAVTGIRRADGAIENGVVSYDSLSDDLKALLNSAEPKITVPDLSPSAFATQSEAEGGVTTDKIMNPLNAKQAMDAQRPFASQVEAEAGSSAVKVLSPLRGKQLLDAFRPFASQTEAEAGSNNTKVVTPLRVAQELAALRPAFTGSSSLTWGSIAAAGSSEQTFTVTGAAAGDRVVLGLPTTLDAGLVAQAWVSAANTVRVRLTNITASPITPASGAAMTFNATALRF